MAATLTYAQLLGTDNLPMKRVGISEHLLHNLIRRSLHEIDFQEEWYLEANGDVASAVELGQFTSGFAHYLKAGYFENRLPRDVRVDTRWYLAAYPTVTNLIQNGHFSSAQEHFQKIGFRDGLLPFADWEL